MSENLTPKQQKFCDYYLELGNATEAAIKAGYKKENANVVASQNLTKLNIKSYIDERLKEIEAKNIATIDEVMSFYTKILRGEEKDQFGLDVSINDRIKAGQELLKRLSVVQDNSEKSKNNMSSLADLLKNPQKNRNIADFENEDKNE